MGLGGHLQRAFQRGVHTALNFTISLLKRSRFHSENPMLPPTTNIPKEFLPLIGRIIVLWAHAEKRIDKTLADLAKVKLKYARAIVKKNRREATW